jgi:hypothetical protein
MGTEIIKILEESLKVIKGVVMFSLTGVFITLLTSVWFPTTSVVMALLLIVLMLLVIIILSGSYIQVSLFMYKQIQKEEDDNKVEVWRTKMSSEKDKK